MFYQADKLQSAERFRNFAKPAKLRFLAKAEQRAREERATEIKRLTTATFRFIGRILSANNSSSFKPAYPQVNVKSV